MRNRLGQSFRKEMHGRDRLAVYYTCSASSKAHIQTTFPSNPPCRQTWQSYHGLANNWERKWNVPHGGWPAKTCHSCVSTVFPFLTGVIQIHTMSLGATGWKWQSPRMKTTWFPQSPPKWEPFSSQDTHFGHVRNKRLLVWFIALLVSLKHLVLPQLIQVRASNKYRRR